MASHSTRYEIVVRALHLAGRDVRLRTLAEEMLNDLLRAWAFEYKYPDLRKVGDEITLAQGSSTAALPSDYGAGMDNLLIGTGRKPLYERSLDEFVHYRGFPDTASSSQGEPTFYCVDKQASLFRFNCAANAAIPFLPIYYRVPTKHDLGASGDGDYVWMENDDLVVQGLVERLYQYTGDQREFTQAQRVEALKAKYRTGAVPMGGGSTRVTLARHRFK